jgi:hypothetical protein
MLGVFKEESYSLGIFMQEENNMASLAGKNVTVRERFTYGSGKGSLMVAEKVHLLYDGTILYTVPVPLSLFKLAVSSSSFAIARTYR